MGQVRHSAQDRVRRAQHHDAQRGAATATLTLWFLAQYVLLVAIIAIAVALLSIPLSHQVGSWFGDVSRALSGR